MPTRSPVPQEVSDALQRVVRRWQQLPLDHALRCAPRVRALLLDLAGEDAPVLPDLGPAVLMDQLTVLVHDAFSEGAAGNRGADDLSSRLRDLLAELG